MSDFKLIRKCKTRFRFEEKAQPIMRIFYSDLKGKLQIYFFKARNKVISIRHFGFMESFSESWRVSHSVEFSFKCPESRILALRGRPELSGELHTTDR